MRKNFSLKYFERFIVSLFNERFKWSAFLIVLGCLVFLIFIWYNYIFQSDWSEAEVQNYTQAKQSKSDMNFNQKNFQKVVDESKNRSAEFERTLNDLQDIFRVKN